MFSKAMDLFGHAPLDLNFNLMNNSHLKIISSKQ